MKELTSSDHPSREAQWQGPQAALSAYKPQLNAAERDRLRSYGPWAVVTGASDGIGRALAVDLASAGLNLLLVARREGKLQALAIELAQRFGVQTRVAALDLAGGAGVSALLRQTESLDVGLLVASAGFGTSGLLHTSAIERELAMLDVNCRAVLVLSHAFANRFIQKRGPQGKRGGLLLLSSLVAFQGVPFAGHYAATKAYVQSLAEALHVELAPHGVDVLASAPGPVHSGFATRADMVMGTALKPAQVSARTLAALGRRMTVRPGWLSKLLAWSLTLPRWGRVQIMKRVMGGMTQHQQPALPSATAATHAIEASSS